MRPDGRAPVSVAAVGECMIELTHLDERTLSLGFAGDTFNTAVYLAGLAGPGRAVVEYVTLVGDDHYSEHLVTAARRLGVGTRHVRTIPQATPGLYLVRTDPDGERHFVYHRSESPARLLFGPRHDPTVGAALADVDVLYLSGITLSLLAPPALARLRQIVSSARRNGATVVFDPNYRPRGWSDPATAREAVASLLPHVDVALPTLADERLLHGDVDASASAERYLRAGAREVVVKDGAAGCLVVADGDEWTVPAARPRQVLDTTAAGDSFNAGYLAGRLAGLTPQAAAVQGHRVAATVIAHPGAIIPHAAMAALRTDTASAPEAARTDHGR